MQINRLNKMKKPRLGSGNSASAPNLATTPWTPTYTGFPLGTTVDELWHYRKRRPNLNEITSDTLRPISGSFKLLKTEYKRRFKDYYEPNVLEKLHLTREDISPSRAEKPGESLKIEGDLDLHSEYGEKFIEYRPEKSERAKPISAPFEVIDFNDAASGPRRHRHPNRRPTTLRLAGEHRHAATEHTAQFVEYLLAQRPGLARRPTTLRLLDAAMPSNTENRDQFVAFAPQARPPLCKKFTNLRLEGELDMLPEYRREFVEFRGTERRRPTLPVHNLTTDGFSSMAKSLSEPFLHQVQAQIPFLRGGADFSRPVGEQPAAGMDSKQPGQHRNAYIDFNRAISPSWTQSRTRRGGKHQPESQLKISEKKMEMSPEYASTYVNFPRERPRVKKPECTLSSDGEMEHSTEKSEKFVEYPNVARTSSLKREPELKLEGQFECQPEYRKAYIDYLIRERVDRKHRPLDNLGAHPRRVLEPEEVPKTGPAPPPLLTVPSPQSHVRENSTLARIESSVFGPKLTVPANPKSRSSSPSGRRKSGAPNSSSTESDVPARRNRRFGNAVRVENLACRSPSLVPLGDITAKNKWMRDSSVESNSAFVVLDRGEKSRWKPSWA